MAVMNQQIEQSLREMLEPVLENYNAFLVEIIARGERNTKIIEIFIDTDKGVDAKTISEINKELNRRLAEDILIPGTYRLSVSSPGLERPLKITRQYKKNLGRELEVFITIDDKTEKITGTLVDADDSLFTLQIDDSTKREFQYDRIQKAFIKLPW
jgi:ribosome maturation factor RimP